MHILQVTKSVLKEMKDSTDQTVSQSDTGKNPLLTQLKKINSNLVDVEVIIILTGSVICSSLCSFRLLFKVSIIISFCRFYRKERYK